MRPRIGFAPRWVAPLFALLALALLPWAVWLARVLPDHHLSAHWNVAWAGFDLGLAAALLATAVAALRRSPWLEGSATAAGTLLVVDAWFDLLTASGGAELIVAAAEAALVELPVAVLCFWIARDAERFLERAQGRLEAVRRARGTGTAFAASSCIRGPSAFRSTVRLPLRSSPAPRPTSSPSSSTRAGARTGPPSASPRLLRATRRSG